MSSQNQHLVDECGRFFGSFKDEVMQVSSSEIVMLLEDSDLKVPSGNKLEKCFIGFARQIKKVIKPTPNWDDSDMQMRPKEVTGEVTTNEDAYFQLVIYDKKFKYLDKVKINSDVTATGILSSFIDIEKVLKRYKYKAETTEFTNFIKTADIESNIDQLLFSFIGKLYTLAKQTPDLRLDIKSVIARPAVRRAIHDRFDSVVRVRFATNIQRAIETEGYLKSEFVNFLIESPVLLTSQLHRVDRCLSKILSDQ